MSFSPSKEPERDELQGALSFIESDLARLVDRLSTFAADRLSTVGVRAEDQRALVRLGQRLTSAAIALATVDPTGWQQAAARYKGKQGRGGWSVTCRSIAQSEKAMDEVGGCAERLRAAAQCLDEAGRSASAATVSAQTRKAADALLAAAACWNRATSGEPAESEAAPSRKRRREER